MRCSELGSHSLPITQVPKSSDHTSPLLGPGLFLAYSWTNIACAVSATLLLLSLLVVCYCAGRSRRLSECLRVQVIIGANYLLIGAY